MAAAHLLNTQSAASDTAKSIVAAAADGTLTEKRLNTLIDEAAQQQSRANYVGELRARSERLFVNAFHQALADGAADQLIDSLRPAWDGAAEAIGAARALINAESSADQILASAQPSVITAWQGLDEHLAVIGKIAAIASQFGPRLGQFPLIKEFANADGFRLEDRAIFATDGGLEVDSGVFRRPDQGTAHHRGSRLPLRLHTVASARERYREWAAAQWEQTHSGPQESFIGEDGKMHEKPRPANPFQPKVTT